MPNLLPERNKKKIKGEYRLRIAIFALAFTFAGIGIGLAFLIPTYVLLAVTYDDALKQKKDISAAAVASQGDKYVTALADTTAKATTLYQDKNDLSLLEVISKITSFSTPGIQLSSIGITKSVSGPGQITLAGVAGTRDSLIVFKNNLGADKTFTQVDHSIADLVKARNVTFTLNVLGSF